MPWAEQMPWNLSYSSGESRKLTILLRRKATFIGGNCRSIEEKRREKRYSSEDSGRLPPSHTHWKRPEGKRIERMRVKEKWYRAGNTGVNETRITTSKQV
jgi:hypothetical protein